MSVTSIEPTELLSRAPDGRFHRRSRGQTPEGHAPAYLVGSARCPVHPGEEPAYPGVLDDCDPWLLCPRCFEAGR